MVDNSDYVDNLQSTMRKKVVPEYPATDESHYTGMTANNNGPQNIVEAKSRVLLKTKEKVESAR